MDEIVIKGIFPVSDRSPEAVLDAEIASRYGIPIKAGEIFIGIDNKPLSLFGQDKNHTTGLDGGAFRQVDAEVRIKDFKPNTKIGSLWYKLSGEELVEAGNVHSRNSVDEILSEYKKEGFIESIR